MTHQNTAITSPGRTAILLIGDLLVVLSFVAIGRQSHALSTSDLLAGLMTAIPFVVGWFAIAPWFGLYRVTISTNWRRLLPRLLATWIIAVPLAHVLRAVMLQRPIPAGIALTFVMVSLTYLGVVMLAWRMAFMVISYWARCRGFRVINPTTRFHPSFRQAWPTSFGESRICLKSK
jgi:hypothetical protein